MSEDTISSLIAYIILPLMVLFLVLTIYFLPTIIASKRGHVDVDRIKILNMFCFTFPGIGWLVVLAIAIFTNKDKPLI